ncbi:MAG: 5-bromo-4-chloroindolyl phosphate hydrolysis family protein [Defluviitaleaceae bacterium]|nr:5-bromo-4-chloroindolyl phosphate hydrolysis family protein [Defluviitaleaceae bacterium]
MKKRIKSIIPIYLTGAAFLVYAVSAPMYSFLHLAMGLAVAVLVYFLGNLVFRGKEVEAPIELEKSGDTATERILAQGRTHMQKLHQLKQQTGSSELKQQIGRLEQIAEQIFKHVIGNPDKGRKLHTFMDYYFPTTIKFLENYVAMEAKAVKGDNIQATMDNIKDSLMKIQQAFEHQLDILYKDSALDIKTDIAVLENIMKQAGL